MLTVRVTEFWGRWAVARGSRGSILKKIKKWRGLLFKTGQFRSNADTTRASRMAGARQPGRWEPNGRVQALEKYSIRLSR